MESRLAEHQARCLHFMILATPYHRTRQPETAQDADSHLTPGLAATDAVHAAWRSVPPCCRGDQRRFKRRTETIMPAPASNNR